MNIFLIRHGESVQNTGDNEILGLADHKVILTDKGREQAYKSAIALKNYMRHNESNLHLARVWYSPYDRTKQTMEEFNKVFQFEKNGVDICEDIRLTEQQFGLFDNIPENKWKELYPNEYQTYQKFRKQKGKFWARLPLGESPFDVALRIRDFFGTIQRDYEKCNIDTLFVFTHGVTLRTFVMQYLHYPVEWYENEHNPGNCWIRRIQDKTARGYIYQERDMGYIYKGE